MSLSKYIWAYLNLYQPIQMYISHILYEIKSIVPYVTIRDFNKITKFYIALQVYAIAAYLSSRYEPIWAELNVAILYLYYMK